MFDSKGNPFRWVGAGGGCGVFGRQVRGAWLLMSPDMALAQVEDQGNGNL